MIFINVILATSYSEVSKNLYTMPWGTTRTRKLSSYKPSSKGGWITEFQGLVI